MPQPSEMSKPELAAVVTAIVEALHGDDGPGYNPDKDGNEDALASVHAVLVRCGLAPPEMEPRSLPGEPHSLTVTLVMGDHATPVACVTLANAVVTVHDSAVTPGAVKIEIDLADRPLVVHLNDCEIYRTET